MTTPKTEGLTQRVVALLRRAAADQRAIARIEMPADLIAYEGLQDRAWGITLLPGPCLAVCAYDMDRPLLNLDHLIRYEEETL